MRDEAPSYEAIDSFVISHAPGTIVVYTRSTSSFCTLMDKSHLIQPWKGGHTPAQAEAIAEACVACDCQYQPCRGEIWELLTLGLDISSFQTKYFQF